MENPISQSINENSPDANLILICQASAYPSATVIWYKNGNITTANVTTVTKSSNTTSTINITTVTVNDVGSYFCQFSTIVGILNSTVATVAISGKL